ncbi:hypothetical protein ACWEO1_40460 [Kitasatospora cineracea]
MSRQQAAQRICDTGRDMGIDVDCGPRTITTWEDGTVARPNPKYCAILTKLTGRTPTELGFAPPGRRPRPGSDGDGPSPTTEPTGPRRREILGTAGALLLSATAPTPGSGRIGGTELRAIAEAEQVLYAADREHGSADIEHNARRALAAARTWIGQGSYGPDTGRRLQSAAGSLSVAVGWLALDGGRTAAARTRYTDAVTAARMADDPRLEAHAFGCLSLLAHTTGRAHEAVSAAQVAQRAVADAGSHRWLSLLAMREARGWALQRDLAQTESALVRAHHHYAKGPSSADPHWLEFYAPAELAGLESLCRADLGQHDRAAHGAEQAVMLFDTDHPRNRALYAADVALHRLAQARPDLDAAADAALRALGHLPGIRSARLQRALHHVASRLAAHPADATRNALEAYRTSLPTTGSPA